jgi:death-on-curing protein
MRYLTLAEVLSVHHRLIQGSGGPSGVRDLGLVESAVAQPYGSFGGQDLYPSLIDKAAALAYSLVKNQPFVDGNKRVAHASMEVFLVLNGYELACSADEQEGFWLALAAGERSRAELVAWLSGHLRPLDGKSANPAAEQGVEADEGS